MICLNTSLVQSRRETCILDFFAHADTIIDEKWAGGKVYAVKLSLMLKHNVRPFSRYKNEMIGY